MECHLTTHKVICFDLRILCLTFIIKLANKHGFFFYILAENMEQGSRYVIWRNWYAVSEHITLQYKCVRSTCRSLKITFYITYSYNPGQYYLDTVPNFEFKRAIVGSEASHSPHPVLSALYFGQDYSLLKKRQIKVSVETTNYVCIGWYYSTLIACFT